MKVLLALLQLASIFFLTGCNRSPWQNVSISNSDLAQLTYPPASEMHGMEFEMTRCGKKIDAYINIRHFELPIKGNGDQLTTLTITANSTSKTFVIPLLQGRQRGHLTDACLKYLLQNLRTHLSVTLSSGHFSETLNTSHFERHHNIFLQRPRIIHRSMIGLELF